MTITDINGSIPLANGHPMPYLGLGVYKAKSGAEVQQAVRYALDAGYRHIDTASFYENEAGVGQAIREIGRPREEVFVTSKVWNDDQGYTSTLQALDDSLNRLQMDYLDLYLIHWPVPETFTETWRALEAAYQASKVKAIGLSNCVQHHLETIMEAGSVKPMVLQNETHPRLVQQPLIEYCKQHHIQYEGWSPLMRGQILDHPLIRTIAEQHHKTAAQVVIRWHLQKGLVTIPKSVHKNRIEENAAVFDFELSSDEMDRIDSLDNNERTGAHPDHFQEHFASK